MIIRLLMVWMSTNLSVDCQIADCFDEFCKG